MINGKLINIRAFEQSDYLLLHKWNNNAEVIRYFRDPYPQSKKEEKKWFEKLLEDEEAKIFTILKKDSVPIGVVYLSKIDWRDRNARASIMIGVKKEWGKGYGVDAMKTLLKFAFEEMNLHRVELDVFEENSKAISCYKKCGFKKEGERSENYFLDGKYLNSYLMAVLDREFKYK
jgi:RimJ/RimL family protein N-acetyltransferase